MILIVDDNPDTSDLLLRLLRRRGFEAIHAPSAAVALKYLHSCPPNGFPNLIVLDIAMPEMNGIECLRVIRAQPGWAQLPVVMYTADFSEARMEEAMGLGAAEYVVKGVSRWEDFLAVVEQHDGSARDDA